MEVCLSQEEVRTRIGGGESEVGEPESEVGEQPGSAGKPGRPSLVGLRAPEQPGLSTFRLGAPESPESGHGAAPRRSRALPEETKR